MLYRIVMLKDVIYLVQVNYTIIFVPDFTRVSAVMSFVHVFAMRSVNWFFSVTLATYCNQLYPGKFSVLTLENTCLTKEDIMLNLHAIAKVSMVL